MPLVCDEFLSSLITCVFFQEVFLYRNLWIVKMFSPTIFNLCG